MVHGFDKDLADLLAGVVDVNTPDGFGGDVMDGPAEVFDQGLDGIRFFRLRERRGGRWGKGIRYPCGGRVPAAR